MPFGSPQKSFVFLLRSLWLVQSIPEFVGNGIAIASGLPRTFAILAGDGW